ncbi:MATE family efflux transporter, partial [bacterium]|nr:MATE family efflux transporter [bacterium]
MMLHLLLGVADIAMVGRLGGDALAATGFARTVIMVLFSLFMGYSQATNALVARYI